MEKTWENFWTSGKVTDYLTYRNSVEDDTNGEQNQGQEKQRGNGTVRDRNGNGFERHAYW